MWGANHMRSGNMKASTDWNIFHCIKRHIVNVSRCSCWKLCTPKSMHIQPLLTSSWHTPFSCSAMKPPLLNHTPHVVERLLKMVYLNCYHRNTINQWGEATFRGSVLVSLCCLCSLCLFASPAEVNGTGCVCAESECWGIGGEGGGEGGEGGEGKEIFQEAASESGNYSPPSPTDRVCV